MRKIILTLLATAFLFVVNACSNSDSKNSDPINACASVSGLEVTQQADQVFLAITSTSTPLYYEISYQLASSNPYPDNGTRFIMATLMENKSLLESNLLPGNTYLFYARAICENGVSDWSSPKVVTISSYCSRPTGLSMTPTNPTLSWTNSTGTNTNCEIQYGVQGFTLGTGTTVALTGYYYSFILNNNTAYDFYVRSYCPSSNSWSPWSDVYLYTPNSPTICNLPSNLSHQIESINGTNALISLHWNYNGGTNFEYAVVIQGASLSSATIYTASTAGWPVINVNRNYTYDFYMRTVCSDGTKTAWTTPYLISNL
jgi:hypothetical protein